MDRFWWYFGRTLRYNTKEEFTYSTNQLSI